MKKLSHNIILRNCFYLEHLFFFLGFGLSKLATQDVPSSVRNFFLSKENHFLGKLG